MMTTEDGGGWSRRRAGCSLKDTVVPDHAGVGKPAQPAWNDVLDYVLVVCKSFTYEMNVSLSVLSYTDHVSTETLLE